MGDRAMNFNPGPAALPRAALERARDELLDLGGTGLSVLEHSHRGAAYGAVHDEALALVRRLLAVPESHDVLFMAGGARMQFALVPTNLRPPPRSADYVLTGHWAKRAHAEAARTGPARVAADAADPEGAYRRSPRPDELRLDPEAAYVHLTSNNTLYGTRWATYPDTGAVPLVADMTSDLFSRPVPWERFGLVYAAAQKNAGPAGVTVVVVRRALLDEGAEALPEAFRYATYAASRSLWNTPPTFSIYMLRNVLAVLEGEGGVAAAATRAEARARRLYTVLDARPDVFEVPAEIGSRSVMNVVFRFRDPACQAPFLEEAAAAGMVGLKGHRAVGGLRASLYNGVEDAWVDALAHFLERRA